MRTIQQVILSIVMLFICQLANGRAVREPTTLNDYISANCSKHCVDGENLLRSVMQASNQSSSNLKMLIAIIKVESSFNRLASSRGNKGLMQIHVRVHKKKIQGRNPFDTNVNVSMGAQIYGACKAKHNDSWKALRCYNGYPRNNKYVNKVKRAYLEISKLPQWNTSLDHIPNHQPSTEESIT